VQAWKGCIPERNAPWLVRAAGCCEIFCEPFVY
jgi:hypothetical protein